jgi:hypothetical protein
MVAKILTPYRRYSMQEWFESLSETNKLYFFIGKTSNWSDDNTPPIPYESVEEIYQDYRDFLALKLISVSDFRYGIKNYSWLVGTIYDSYDSADVNLYTTKKFYVKTSDNNVYKCLFNVNGAASTIEPSGTGASIITTGDGYKWKYIYTIAPGDAAFITDSWIPVYNNSTVQSNAIDGTIDRIVLINGGSGYSSATITITSSTGSGATATAIISSGVITGINLTSAGSGYRDATITITSSTGSGATSRAIISPYGGHGSDVFKEFNVKNILLNVFVTGDEGGKFPVDISFRKLGIIKDPLLLLNNSVATGSTYTGSEIKVGAGEIIYISYRSPILRTIDSSNKFNFLLTF